MSFIYWMIVDIDELNQMFLNIDNFYLKHPNPQFEGNSTNFQKNGVVGRKIWG